MKPVSLISMSISLQTAFVAGAYLTEGQVVGKEPILDSGKSLKL
jgi:hypothetical protein